MQNADLMHTSIKVREGVDRCENMTSVAGTPSQNARMDT